MPQPPPKPWKKAVFAALAQIEHTLRGDNRHALSDTQQIRNFLILQYDAALGSVIHATPIFEALRRTLPDARVTIAASRMAASVLDRNPYIDRCVVTPDPFTRFCKTASAVHELLQSMPPGPRCVLTTIGNRRPSLAVLSMLAGKALRAGHTAAPEIYDVPSTFIPERGQIEGNLDILRSLGHDVAFCEPRMFFTREDADYAARLLTLQNEPAGFPRIACVTQNSGGQRNQWSSERFIRVIAELSRMRGAIPIFVGTSADADAIRTLQQNLPQPGISMAGKTTVPQLAAVLAHCDLAVSLDTGTFHVARAVGLPGVVLAPAWQNPREWLPIDHARYRVVRGPSITLPQANYRMEEISVDQVISAAIELMESFPVSAEARRTRVERALAKSRPA